MSSSDAKAEAQAVLIVAPSGRALAGAARRAGYAPLVVDFFDDLDTRSLAAANLKAAVTDAGFDSADLIACLHALAAKHAPIGLVYGGGFEDRPQLLAELARHFRLLGNPPETVARAKDPQNLEALCRRLHVPHPQIRFDAPADLAHWLIKRKGGGGGLHVTPAETRRATEQEYYQRRVAGQPVSALLLASAQGGAYLLGLSAQWTTGSSDMPFRFGGAVRPARLESALAAAIGEAAEKIAIGAGLVGLNSIDFLVCKREFHLLEINPRPGATLDIFADREGRLFSAHLKACAGRLPRRPLVFKPAAATAIAYAPCDLAFMPQLNWPNWCQDRQKSETHLRKGDPVCTVFAEASTPEAARTLLNERLAIFLHQLADRASKEAAA